MTANKTETPRMVDHLPKSTLEYIRFRDDPKRDQFVQSKFEQSFN